MPSVADALQQVQLPSACRAHLSVHAWDAQVQHPVQPGLRCLWRQPRRECRRGLSSAQLAGLLLSVPLLRGQACTCACAFQGVPCLPRRTELPHKARQGMHSAAGEHCLDACRWLSAPATSSTACAPRRTSGASLLPAQDWRNCRSLARAFGPAAGACSCTGCSGCGLGCAACWPGPSELPAGATDAAAAAGEA